MISPERRIQAFVQLGHKILDLLKEEENELFYRAENQNNWFTLENCKRAFEGLAFMLEEKSIRAWLEKYKLPTEGASKDVGVLMAGNIPAVGFHDLACVLLSGHTISAKLSSVDTVLMKWLIDQLISIEPSFESNIQISEMLKAKDAYIATGSDNSSRYFHYYFGKYPSLIRQNRTSVAILTGQETDQEILDLGKDVFLYFGLGCRNVSKVFVPDKDILQRVLGLWEVYASVADHHKYHNNYDYNKSIYLVNNEPHLDNGFLLLKQDSQLVSPISVLFYEVYDGMEELELLISSQLDKIQCIVGNTEVFKNAISFGKAQSPGPEDYADGEDTLKFLLSL
jgi:hypothetical protein